MVIKLLVFFVIIWVKANGNKFVIVSTNQESFNGLPDFQNPTIQTEHKVIWDPGLNEINRRLKNIETQNEILVNEQKSEETLESKITQILERLKQLEDQNKLIIKKIETQTSTRKSEPRCKSTALPRNCQEVKMQNFTTSNIYLIQPDFSPHSFLVWCNMDSMGGGWTSILNRVDDSQDFALNWTDYKNGFGDLRKNFWLGLDKIHYLTGFTFNELLVELVDWDNKTTYANYKNFSVSNEDEGYLLKLASGYSGTSGDAFSQHEGMKFSTKDKDQDKSDKGNCSKFFGGAGWWFNNCYNSLLTGKYINGKIVNSHLGLIKWRIGKNFDNRKIARMMVRPKYY